MFSRTLLRGLLAVLFAISGKAQFEIRGSRLYLNGSAFTVHGVAYSPMPIGQVPAPVLQLSGCLYNRDFPLMPLAGINTVRLYSQLPAGEAVFWQALTANHLYVLAGFPLDAYYSPLATLSPDTPDGRALRAAILEDFRRYAGQLQASQRVIAIVLGNELADNYNSKFAGVPADFYSLLQEAAMILKASFGDTAPLLTTAVAGAADIGQAVLGTRDIDLPGLSFWSINANRGSSIGGFFSEAGSKTAKPVLVSEFGVDAFDTQRQVEDAASQAAALHSLAKELATEAAQPDSAVIGGVWFGWSDEWWRGSAGAAVHGTGGTLETGVSDGFWNPAWFGLFGVTATDQPGLDSLRARPTFAALASEWGGHLPDLWPPSQPKLSQQGVVNAASLAATIAPGSLVSLFGQNLAMEPSSSLASPLPFQMALSSVCLGSRPAPLLAATTGQINGQAPWETVPSRLTPTIVYNAGVASNTVPVQVQPAAPGILESGVIPVGRPCPVSTASGVRPGTYLEIYGTGLGAAAVAFTTGVAPLAAAEISAAPRAFLGAQELRVLYSGLVPGVVGLYQTDVQVPPDYPAGSPFGLALLAGGIESNVYPLSVISDDSQPAYTLDGSALTYTVQAGGPPQTALLSIAGQNGFCEIVRFVVAGLPPGISVSLPVGFPGQTIPVTVSAAANTPAAQDAIGTISGASFSATNPRVNLHVSVLPSQGDIPFRVTSGGGRAGLIARFEMAGRVLAELHGGGVGRGFNFMTLNGRTGVLGALRTFDTWLNDQASEEMADYLEALPAGTLVLGAIADEGTLHLTPRCLAALRNVLRSQTAADLQYQDSWAVVSRVGAASPVAEGRSGDTQVVLERVLTFPMP
jgi:uncharacterized protein (TIGR03437 family)